MMKKMIYMCSLLLLIMASCSKEDELQNSIDYSSPYVITEDDPNDPVQHRIYTIYQKYSVPVFFKDTIQQRLVAYNAKGEPVYQYETLDLKWTFTGYSQDAEYHVEKYKTEEEQLKALDFIEYYLNKVSRKMRPFCIYPVRAYAVGTEFPDYGIGFRVLVLPGVDEIEDLSQRDELCNNVIGAMVLDRVKQNNELVARFTNVSQKKKWYALPWKGTSASSGLACSYKYTALTWTLNPALMYSKVDDFLTSIQYIIEHQNEYEAKGFKEDREFSEEYAYEIRRNITLDIGQYGFISGGSTSQAYYSPDNASEDLRVFVGTAIGLGDAGFKERFGDCPLVMKKYNLLYDYITEVLEYQL